MSIVLAPDVERQIEELMRIGGFVSRDDCVRQSVQLMFDRETRLRQRRDELARGLEEGINDLENGRFIEVDDAGLIQLFEDIRRTDRNTTTNGSKAE